jgi:hypothetical protein
VRIAHQAHGLPGDPEAALYLRADRAIPDEPAELLGEQGVLFVPPVPTDPLPEQTGADPQRYGRLRHLLAPINPASKTPPFFPCFSREKDETNAGM